VPVAPGGAIDVVGRIAGTRLAEVLGQSVVIDNRASANNIIGTEIAARAIPDGVHPAHHGRLAHDQFLKEDLQRYARIATAAMIEPQ
jgi:hypothetical protein